MGSAVMGAIVNHVLGRKKVQTEIESLVVHQYKDLLDSTRAELASTRVELIELRLRMDNYSQRELHLMKEIEDLKSENKQLRIEVDKLTGND